MNHAVSQWVLEQQRQQREIILVIDSMADPNPITYLFGADVMHDYARLYANSPLASFIESSPWLVRVSVQQLSTLTELLENPQRNWGWLASTTQTDIYAHAQHWLERALIDDGAQRSLYRLQDNRVMAHHLSALDASQRSLLLGELNSALCWGEEQWSVTDNPQPRRYPQPFATPWLNIAEPQAVTDAIVRHNLKQWLWDTYPHATFELLETQPLDPWLDENLQLAKTWGWSELTQLEFLLALKLQPETASSPHWLPFESESSAQHFSRCRDELQIATA